MKDRHTIVSVFLFAFEMSFCTYNEKYLVCNTLSMDTYTLQDLNNLSVHHVDQLIQQARSVLSEEEKALFSQEMKVIEQDYTSEINSLELIKL